MKTNILSQFILAGALLLTVACTSGETTRQEQIKDSQDIKGLTAFVVEDNTTRTTGEYDGSGINFYWTEGDRLWVNNATLKQDVRNNISNVLVPNPTTTTGVKRAATAKFYFEGNFTAPSYPVRYTGKGSTVGDKVIFKATQNQPVANDASHIGESGDCGIATATKPVGSGKYNFTLEHKASYLTLLPYSTINFSTNVKLTQVKITADEALSGQFNFDDNGINLGSRPTPTTTNRSITLTLNGGGTNGFTLPVAATPNTSAAIIVLPPGTYNNVSIEYSLYDRTSTKSAIIKKEYATLTFTPGKNKKITTNLTMPVYITPMGPWNGTGPNSNETLWYLHKGDPHLDESSIYAARRAASLPANICRGGVWIKKWRKIPGFSRYIGHDGVNHIGIINGVPNSGINYYEFPFPTGIPTNIKDYYFLPSVFPADNNEIKSYDGVIRYRMGTYYSSLKDQGQIFSADVLPTPKIGIGTGPVSVIVAYWRKQ
ncbi:hypothetical protein J5A66_03835 [Prevotella sp. oral taxon 475]|uniref:hypothetical protein n=1 Tax=Prevotella sp. oral taxon 475 TaxID=712471 RepID=UPI001BA6A8CF|nr:hypothetical protein [Prevotella sp. oral taxon 475]QUB47934.1 hypothetical protein J5A66_03835 [Prevotella sp. oral taxon 475]